MEIRMSIHLNPISNRNHYDPLDNDEVSITDSLQNDSSKNENDDEKTFTLSTAISIARSADANGGFMQCFKTPTFNTISPAQRPPRKAALIKILSEILKKTESQSHSSSNDRVITILNAEIESLSKELAEAELDSPANIILIAQLKTRIGMLSKVLDESKSHSSSGENPIAKLKSKIETLEKELAEESNPEIILSFGSNPTEDEKSDFHPALPNSSLRKDEESDSNYVAMSSNDEKAAKCCKLFCAIL